MPARGLPTDQQKLYDALIEGFTKLVRVKGGSRSGDDDSQLKNLRKDYLKSVNKNIKTTDEINKALAEVLVTVKDSRDGTTTYNDAIARASSALINSSKTLGQFQHELDMLAYKSIPEQRHYIETHSNITKGLTTELGKTLRNQSLFSAALLEGHTEIRAGSAQYAEMIHKMYAASKGLPTELLAAADVLDEKTGAIKEGLRPADFAKLRLSLGLAESAIAEGFGQFNKLGLGDMQKIIAEGGDNLSKTMFADDEAGKQFKAALLSATLQLQRQGIAVGPSLLNEGGGINSAAVEQLQTDPHAMQDLANSIKQLQGASGASSEGLNKIAKDSNTVWGSFTKKVTTTGGMLTHLSSKLGEFATAIEIAASFEKLKSGLKSAYDQLEAFNISNIPAKFTSVQLASVKLGMSFQDTVKFMQENKNVMAIYGDNFDNLTGQMKGTFQRFGINMQQGASLIGPAISEAIASGVNIRNGDALNNFISKTLMSFDNLSTVIDITREEYIKQTAQMLSSADVQDTLLGLDTATAQARAQEIVSTRDLLAAQTGSLELANEEIARQQAQKNAPVKDRLMNSARIMQQAQIAQMSPRDAQRLAMLSLKDNLSPDEQKQYNDLNMKRYQGIQAFRDRAGAQGINSQLAADNLINNIATTSQSEIDKLPRAELERQRAQVNQTDAEKQAALNKAKPNETVATFGNYINFFKSLKDNAFTSIVLGATGAVGGLAVQALLAGRALGTISGTSVLGGIKDMFKNGGGKGLAEDGVKIAEKAGLKGLGKSFLKKIPILGLLAGGLFAGQRALSGDFTGAAGELASGIAGTIPGIGTAASVAIDAGLAAKDVYNASASPSAPPTVSTPSDSDSTVNSTPDVSTQAPTASGIMMVQDAQANDYLLAISTNIAQLVKMIQDMSETSAPTRSYSRPMSAVSSITGRY